MVVLLIRSVSVLVCLGFTEPCFTCLGLSVTMRLHCRFLAALLMLTVLDVSVMVRADSSLSGCFQLAWFLGKVRLLTYRSNPPQPQFRLQVTSKNLRCSVNTISQPHFSIQVNTEVWKWYSRTGTPANSPRWQKISHAALLALTTAISPESQKNVTQPSTTHRQEVEQ